MCDFLSSNEVADVAAIARADQSTGGQGSKGTNGMPPRPGRAVSRRVFPVSPPGTEYGITTTQAARSLRVPAQAIQLRRTKGTDLFLIVAPNARRTENKSVPSGFCVTSVAPWPSDSSRAKQCGGCVATPAAFSPARCRSSEPLTGVVVSGDPPPAAHPASASSNARPDRTSAPAGRREPRHSTGRNPRRPCTPASGEWRCR